jgi:serine/threonine protein kinase
MTREQHLVWKPYDTYSDVTSMAHGSEAQTHLTKSTTTGRVYVVKRFTQYPVFSERHDSHQGDQPLPNEATVLLKALRPHPNILRAFRCDCFGGMISNLYTEHCSGGDLTEQMLHFHKINRTPPERFVLHVFISLAHALCYIHNGLRWDLEEKVYWQEPGFNTPYIHADGM